ncbi:twin-arginine translocase subunit TatC [Haloarculaceae archaeon H-GB2-1]|nr:twin-arginine translocase subunit TatC [Haloarculaceae archaeon H-GB1-1]MEA5406857.1 twin-arginine translocase subunit TatC [Haloarculaceae archaeon H-GB2-1]
MADGEPASPEDSPSGFEAPPGPLDEPPDPPDPEGLPSAPDDQEMPLADHIEEMVQRLLVVLVVLGVASGIVFPFADQLINFLWYEFLPGTFEQCPTRGNSDIACPHLYHPLALMLARFKVSSLVGFIVALPVGVYQTYRFMRPGLYPRERKYYLASVPTSLVLASFGVLFAFFLVLPVLFVFFTGYTQSAANVAFGLGETFNLIVLMIGFFALIFQIPLLVMLAIMMGLTTEQWLTERRLYFWGGFATVAFIFSPDPTGMAPFLVAMTMIGLFEGTLGLLRWTKRDSLWPAPAALEKRRPTAWLLAGLVGYLASSIPVPPGYISRLPTPVIDALASANLLSAMPLVIALLVVVAFEATVYVLTQARRWTVRRLLIKIRGAVWLAAVVLGYLGSPNAILRTAFTTVNLPTRTALLVAGATLVAFEATIFVSRAVRGD